MYPLTFKMSVLIWIIILQAHFSLSAARLQDERSYLLDFKSGLEILSDRLSSWRGFNCCEWEGVACDYHTSHVISLDLSTDPDASDWSTNHLSGELRPLLFNLQHLQHLDLSGNDFKGIPIPPQLSKLQKLVVLKLSNSGFGGEVPLELGNMSSMRHLDISHNDNLIGSMFHVWVRNLRSLEFLRMEGVNRSMASEHWGDALSGLPNLSQIHLSHCGLSGKIPDLSNLTRLSHLHIAENSFPFHMPSWFENVSSLLSLDLNSCGLNGFIPPNFMPRSRLQILDLGYNNLEGRIPSSFGSFSALGSLVLSHNRLSGHIPQSLCQLHALNELYLGHNNFSGTIPDSISNLVSLRELSLPSTGLGGNMSLKLFENLTHLEDLNLSENQLFIEISTSWVPQFAKLGSLELRSCNIEGKIPPFLSQQYQLNWLDLSDNKIVGDIPSWLWDLSYLVALNLSKNNLESSLPLEISNPLHTLDLHGNRLHGTLPLFDYGLMLLDLSNNAFNGSIPERILVSPYLSLSGNNLTGEIPSSICSEGIYVTVLDLSKNKLTGVIPSEIGNCYYLEILKLSQNALRGGIPEELGYLESLRTLNLNGNMLQGTIPASFASCSLLQIFDLGNNNFEDRIPVWIEKLTDLRILSLASNKFNGRIPLELFRLQNLQILDLPGNQLSGDIPSHVNKLCAMVNNSQSFHLQYSAYYEEGSAGDTYYGFNFADEVTVWIKGRVTPYSKINGEHKFMDLSRNNLSGNIPPELGLLRGLISLNISKNNLSGIIPESLGAMACLESLDLSENKLSGKIPIQLLNLTFLEVLNLSENMLSGLIPQGKQFSTFEASSFLGNPNLHGFQLENMTRGLGFGGKDNYKDLNNTANESVDADVMDTWWAVGVGLCYGVGFATVIAVLCFHLKWRYICFSFMDNFIHYLFE